MEAPLKKLSGVLRRTSRRVLLGAATSLLLASWTGRLSAQDPVALAGLASAEIVEVRVINLEIRAFDRQGRAIEDLRPEELELTVDGQRVPIRYFARFPEGQTESPADRAEGSEVPTPAVATPEERRQRVVVFVDDFFLGPASRARAVPAIVSFLDQLPREAEVLLASFDRSGLSVRVPFSTDRRRVADTLRGLALAASEGFRRDAELQGTLGTLRELQRSKFEGGMWGIDPPCSRDLLEIARGHAGAQYADVRRSLDGLRLLVDSLASTPGRKALVHVSDGLPLRSGTEAFEYLRILCDGSGARQGVQWALDVSAFGSELPRGELIDPPSLAMASLEFDAVPQLQEVTRHANSSGVTIYPLQAMGLAAVGAGQTGEYRSSTTESEQAGRFNAQDTLSQMASQTGGRAILQRNDLDVALATVATDLDRFVSIGFDPPAPSGKSNRPHTVTVRTTRDGVELRYRRSYRDVTSANRIAERLLAALFHGATDDPLAVRLQIARRQPPDKPGFVARLSIPTGNLTLLDGNGGAGARSGLLAVHMVLQDDDGLSPVRRADVPVRLPMAGPDAPPFVYEVRFGVPKGKAMVAIAIEDLLGRKTTVLRREFD